MSSNQSDLINLVKKWIKLDEELRQKKKEVRELRDQQKEFTNSLSLLMDEKNIDGLNLNDESKIVYKKQKVKGGITKKVLLKGLTEYFDDTEINTVIQNVLSQRSETVKNSIERK